MNWWKTLGAFFVGVVVAVLILVTILGVWVLIPYEGAGGRL